MRKGSDTRSMVLCALIMVLLILDSGCAAKAAAEAVEVCLRTVIPGLFPMFVLSAWLSPRIGGFRIPWLGRLLKLPPGSEGLFLLGLVGGFPTGGAVISQCAAAGTLPRADAERMLGFCNNCAPAFLFGVVGTVLGDPALAAVLAVIQTASAMIIGMLWPGSPQNGRPDCSDNITLPQAIRRAVYGLSNVCAWVVLASVTVGFLRRWLFPLLPAPVSLLLTGAMELTAGILSLSSVSSPETRFLAACVFVSFGGAAVLIQIQAFASAAGLGMRTCVLQKLTQGLLSGILAVLLLRFGPAGLIAGMALPLGKLAVEILRPLVYNTPSKGGI